VVAQNSNRYSNELTLNTNESIYIHINGTSFVSGEKLFYKLYLLNPTDNKLSLLSKIAYVELVKTDKKIVFSHKLFLEKGNGQGDFLIPSDLKTGNYKLVAYTKWMLNKNTEKFFESDIFIVNPFEKLNISQVSNSSKLEEINKSTTINYTNNTSQKSDYSFQIAKKQYSKREKVDLKIQSLSNQNLSGNFSLSVRKIDDLPSTKKVSAIEYINNYSQKNTFISQNNILPELRGEMIEGKIISKSGALDVKNKTVAISIPGKTFAFHLSETNSDGKFIFNLDKPYYSSDMNIQVVDENQKDYDIVIEKNGNVSNGLLFDKPFVLSPDLKNTLQERSIASQIENAYFNKKTDSLTAGQKQEAFYDPISKNYILDNYTRFKTLKETSVEIIPEMYFSKKDNHNFLYLRDYSGNTKLNEPALVLIDGLLIQNTDELYEYNANLIHMISIIPGAYYYGTKVFNGVINIVTKNNDFASINNENVIHKIALQRPLPKKIYFKQDYSDAAKYERIPDYRNQLIWIPEVDINEAISFYTSDISGNFEVILEGFSADGKPISLRETFVVE